MANRFLGLGSGKSGAIALGSYTQTWYSCSGSSGATSLSVTGTFSAGDRIFIHQTRGTGAGGYEDNTVLSYTTGTITLVHPLLQTYTDSGASQAQVAVVKEAASVSGSFTVGAWDGDVGGIFVMACNGVFSGTVNASGKGFRGASSPATGSGNQGESYINIGSETYLANGTGGGAGNSGDANFPGAGGAGAGHATSGTNGTLGSPQSGFPVAGLAGGTVGDAQLTALHFGGGGGSGKAYFSGSWNIGGAGGSGGGIIVVYAKSFSNTASLIVNGNNGTAGGSTGSGAAGAGAGGSVLIKSVSSAIGTSKITAIGGSGASSGGSGGNGGNGGVGRVRIESCSLSGTTSPTASTQTGGFNYCGTNIAIL